MERDRALDWSKFCDIEAEYLYCEHWWRDEELEEEADEQAERKSHE